MYQGKKVGVILLAAGSGTRMGPGRAKQYREVGGKTVLERALAIFVSHPAVDDIVLVAREEERAFCSSLGLTKGGGKVRALVPGGETRQDSVWSGLRMLNMLREAEPQEAARSVDGDLVLVHDGARPFTSRDLVDRVLQAAKEYGAAIPCVPVSDTIKLVDGEFVKKTIPRESLYGAQTPQGFCRSKLTAAMEKAQKKHRKLTDDASALEWMREPVRLVEGDRRNLKITTIEDMATAEMLAAVQDKGFRPTARYLMTGTVLPEGAIDAARQETSAAVPNPKESPAISPEMPDAASNPKESPVISPEMPATAPSPEPPQKQRALHARMPGSGPKEPAPQEETVRPTAAGFRIGEGYDVHMLVPDRPLVLGGVTVPYEKGLLGHSDADVATHAVMDGLLGAAGLGDIGQLFPDNDPAYEGAYSMALLEVVRRLLEKRGLTVGNLDVTIEAQAPKLAPYVAQMRAGYARVLHMEEDRINVKATTTEHLGFVGRSEGIAAHAVCLLVQSGEPAASEQPLKPVQTPEAEQPSETGQQPQQKPQQDLPHEARLVMEAVPQTSGWTHLVVRSKEA